MQMIERVACAVYTSLLPGGQIWDELAAAERSPYREIARKALVELRMPTEEMLAEGMRHDLPADAANIWERMIYRALTD